MNMTVKFAESDSTSKAILHSSDQAFDAAIGLGNIKAGHLTENEAVVGATLSTSDQELNVKMDAGGGSGGFPLYRGEYEVTPKVTEQTLETAMRSMDSDVTIHAIPYYEVDNIYQGQTVIIGGS